ncbi:hypothetical protein CcaverHIS002_0504090 [Cutaneotrichosporon cavernicola]|uniref:Phosphoglycerate mutase-like protein n=1 Tax=Cutaneotrichosporon cavernicola TaxID=279322 RepID=A0AA48QWY8_9TREE|nr:uncharacterized protein CcaverHIS019_0504640 [Cutaneotrichosporon cavernicola]BEI85008.1 hypothetical protein CcaverHIS002_0504090 [Cutaneotrichosporon cavernicola]BEI92836.1 hypothetical protein CcaverHIS019_0504640 [Cutaneotrichosporon cavernicola]BEJ00612.1 hypothetical protein CcaverHIS631_0504690 [Cutaneotrichosporon cavernicola]
MPFDPEHHDATSTRGGHVPHALHPDQPPVAATETGGPDTSPGDLERPHAYLYEAVEGFFLQTEGPKKVDFDVLLKRSFGLLDTSAERWPNLRAAVSELQRNAGDGVAYKVLFLGRHGQGWHNFAAAKYGHDAWEEHYTYQTTDGELTWGPDPELTDLGHEQARAVRRAWGREVDAGAPIDEMTWFVSPLTRTCQTFLDSWEGLYSCPEVWEDWREIYGSHTCDRRSPRTAIATRFPMMRIEEAMTEADELWRADERESDEHMQMRMRRAMDRVMANNYSTYISVTAHAAILRNLLPVLGHHPYPLATGEMIPVVVKATRLEKA